MIDILNDKRFINITPINEGLSPDTKYNIKLVMIGSCSYVYPIKANMIV